MAGTLEAEFTASVGGTFDGFVPAVAIQADGKIIVGGEFSTVNGQARQHLARLTAGGALESTADFNTGSGVGGGALTPISCVAVQPDGKIIIAGDFETVNGVTRTKIARLNPDGTLESSDTFKPVTLDRRVLALALQPDGRIIIGGEFSTVNGQARGKVARLLPDGTLESTLTFNNGPGADDIVSAIKLQADGKILLGGRFGRVHSQIHNRIARLFPNGNAESATAFKLVDALGDQVVCMAVQPDGKIIIGGAFNFVSSQRRGGIARLLPDGTLESTATFDTGLGGNLPVQTLTLQTDGKIIVGGRFLDWNGQPRRKLVRLLPNGALEPTTTFNTGTGPSDDMVTVSLQADGKIVAGGFFTQYNGQDRRRLVRLANDPAAQTLTFLGRERVLWLRSGAAPEVEQVTFEMSPDNGASWSAPVRGSRVAGGWESPQMFLPARGIVRARGQTSDGAGSYGLIEQRAVFGPGTLDAGFAHNLTGDTYALAVQPDGKLLVGGGALAGPTPDIARLHPDGTRESTATFNVGTGTSSPIARSVRSLSLQPDGKIVVAGIFTAVNGQPNFGIARLLSNGSVESPVTFSTGAGPTSYILNTLLQPDGKMVIAGFFDAVDNQPRNRLARLHPDGSVESSATFRIGAGPDGSIYALALQPDGKILVGGNFIGFNGVSCNNLVRLQHDGTVETAFTSNLGSGFTPGQVECIVVQPDGLILVGGSFTTVNGLVRRGIARLLPNGTVESSATFNIGEGIALGSVFSIALQADGKILIGGGFNTVNGVPRQDIARLLADGAVENNAGLNVGAMPTRISVRALALQADGSVLASGLTADNTSRLVRLLNDPAAQSLAAPDRTRVQWHRSGAAPEISPAVFELSADGTDWTVLGTGARVSGGWELSGLRLPLRGFIRASGRTTGGNNNASSGIVQTQTAFEFPVPEITVHNGPDNNAPELTSGQEQPVDFGTTRQGTPVVHSFLVRNTGTAPLNVTTLTPPPGYRALLNPALPATVAANDILTFQISLHAEASGQFPGSIVIASDDDDEAAFSFPVTGTVVTPEIAVHDGPAVTAPALTARQTAAVDFGRHVQGTPGVRSFTIANTGTAPLLVSGVTVPAGYTALNPPTLPLTVGINQAAVIQISLSTLTVGTYTGSVMITSDDFDEAAFDFPITGEVFIPGPVATPPAAATVLNRQTGLREQKIHINNDTTATVPAYNLIIRGLPAGVDVNNASETRSDGSVVVYIRQAMQPHSTQDIVIEYYSANRGPAEISPQLSTEVVLIPPDLTVPAGIGGFAIDKVARLNGGEMLIEFTSVPGGHYQVHYSDNGTNWQASLPSIRAAANRTQWIDRGLPRTGSHPALSPNRFYRVAELAR